MPVIISKDFMILTQQATLWKGPQFFSLRYIWRRKQELHDPLSWAPWTCLHSSKQSNHVSNKKTLYFWLPFPTTQVLSLHFSMMSSSLLKLCMVRSWYVLNHIDMYLIAFNSHLLPIPRQAHFSLTKREVWKLNRLIHVNTQNMSMACI